MSSSNSAKDYQVEYFEKYHGDASEVKKEIEDCPKCGFKFFITHTADYQNMIARETASCTNCDYGQRKTLHVIN